MAKTRKPTKKALQATEKRLLEERDELQRQLTVLDRRTFEGAEGELPSEPGIDEDLADLGSDTFERERDLSLAENLRDLLDQVEHALRRIEDGSYGVCESCGKPIEAARMKALPHATLCIDCKRREERR